MANEYYDHTTFPTTNSAGSSASMRTELNTIEAGFDKLPTLTAKANRVTAVNAGATALESKKLGLVDAGIGGNLVDENGNEILTLTGVTSAVNEVTLTNAATAGVPTISATGGDTNISLNLAAKGSGTVNVGGVQIATISASQTLTTKTINLASNTLTGTLAQFNSACSDADFASLAGSETLTTKTIDLASNTVTGTLAQFNTACSDANFASLAGNETLTTKGIDLANNTVTGTLAQFNTACSDANFASIAGTETLTGKSYENAVFTKSVTETVATANSGTSYTVDLDNGTILVLTLTGNLGTFNFPTATAGKQFTLLLAQDATGSRTVAWPASVRWPSGVTPVHTATASKTDIFSFIADGTYWLGAIGGKTYTRA